MAPSTNYYRNKIAIRMVRLQRLLEGCTCLPHVPWMAHCLRVHERTVTRDLAALREAGWPVPPERRTEAA